MTAEALQERIDAYCARYGVRKRPSDGLPPYPAGERESRQHREWIVLFKAVSRFRKRQAALPSSPERAEALKAQKARCPICLAAVGPEDVVASTPGVAMTIVHPDCDQVLRTLLKLGPSGLERLRSLAWPEAPPSPKGSSR